MTNDFNDNNKYVSTINQEWKQYIKNLIDAQTRDKLYVQTKQELEDGTTSDITFNGKFGLSFAAVIRLVDSSNHNSISLMVQQPQAWTVSQAMALGELLKQDYGFFDKSITINDKMYVRKSQDSNDGSVEWDNINIYIPFKKIKNDIMTRANQIDYEYNAQRQSQPQQAQPQQAQPQPQQYTSPYGKQQRQPQQKSYTKQQVHKSAPITPSAPVAPKKVVGKKVKSQYSME